MSKLKMSKLRMSKEMEQQVKNPNKKYFPNPVTKTYNVEMTKRYVPSLKRQKQLDSSRGMSSSRNMLNDQNPTDAS